MNSDATSTFDLPLQDFLVDGMMLGDSGEAFGGACYLGLFSSEGSAQQDTTVYAGVLFLQKFYAYFDASQCKVSGDCTHLTVTAGMRNQSAQILQAQYNDSAPYWDEKAGDQSEWSRYPNRFTLQAERQAAEAREAALYYNSVTFVTVMLLLALTTVCLISYKQRQDADKVPDLVFKVKDSIYKKNEVKLMR